MCVVLITGIVLLALLADTRGRLKNDISSRCIYVITLNRSQLLTVSSDSQSNTRLHATLIICVIFNLDRCIRLPRGANRAYKPPKTVILPNFQSLGAPLPGPSLIKVKFGMTEWTNVMFHAKFHADRYAVASVGRKTANLTNFCNYLGLLYPHSWAVRATFGM